MKAKWKTPGESSFMDLGNDFFLIKFSTSKDCSKVQEDRPYFIQKQVISLLNLPLFGHGSLVSLSSFGEPTLL